MIDRGMFESKKTYHDYISRLRYVSEFYRLDKTITKEYIEYILNDLTKTAHERNRYNTKKGISDIHSGLNKFLEYAHADYERMMNETIISEETDIEQSSNLKNTEKLALIKSRVGQGVFREKLISYWNGCAVTGCKTRSILVASHIKPWYKSDNSERLDVFNGLLLVPTLDKLFDRGYISFDNEGRIIISESFPSSDKKLLHIDNPIGLIRLSPQHGKYLDYHRDYCFL